MSPFEELFKFARRPLVVMGYLGFVILSFIYFDKPIAIYFYSFDVKTHLPFVYWLTHIGISTVYIVLFFLLALFFRYIRQDKIWELRYWFLWLCLCLPNVVCLFFKMLLGRARPVLFFNEQLYGFYGLNLKSSLFWSFPSGHTTTIMGLAFGLCALFPRYCYVFSIVGVLAVSTRVLLADHYLSDVVMTSYLTLLEVGLIRLFLYRKRFRPILYCE